MKLNIGTFRLSPNLLYHQFFLIDKAPMFIIHFLSVYIFFFLNKRFNYIFTSLTFVNVGALSRRKPRKRLVCSRRNLIWTESPKHGTQRAALPKMAGVFEVEVDGVEHDHGVGHHHEPNQVRWHTVHLLPGRVKRHGCSCYVCQTELCTSRRHPAQPG